VQDGQLGVVAAAWLDGVSVQAGERLLLGMWKGRRALANLKVYGVSASRLDTMKKCPGGTCRSRDRPVGRSPPFQLGASGRKTAIEAVRVVGKGPSRTPHETSSFDVWRVDPDNARHGNGNNTASVRCSESGREAAGANTPSNLRHPTATVYSFTGATPDAFLDPDIPDDHKIILKQSYRVPEAVHGVANQLIHCVTSAGEDISGAAGGWVGGAVDARLLQSPEYHILKTATEHLERGQSVMFLASCSFMLQPVVKVLRANAIPFWNPYRKANGFWNPIRTSNRGSTANRILSLLWRTQITASNTGLEPRRSDGLGRVPGFEGRAPARRQEETLHLGCGPAGRAGNAQRDL